MAQNIIEECYQKSIDLLIKNSTRFGVLACSGSKQVKAIKRNYLSVFSRDACISLLGMVASQRKDLIKISKASLKILAKYQALNGQIPNYVKPEQKYVNFWYFGCIDATLWWLLGLQFYHQYSGDQTLLLSLKDNVNKAINWLLCQEHCNDGLIMQNEASDWADIMPRSGKVLYSNALWYKVKSLYKIKNTYKTKLNFNNLFYPFNDYLKFIKSKSTNLPNISLITAIINNKKPTYYYLSFVNYLFWGDDIDVFGNTLAILFGLADKNLQNQIINYILGYYGESDFPLPVVFNPITKNSKLWRKYMKNHNLNMPDQYHNGGIWPFASCFWVIALQKARRIDLAKQELNKIALANKINNWQFNEWLHGATGKPMGIAGQSWNAGMFIFTYQYLRSNNFKNFFNKTSVTCHNLSDVTSENSSTF